MANSSGSSQNQAISSILQYSMVLDEIPDVAYERKCRNNFTHKTSLAKFNASNSFSSDMELKQNPRRTPREPYRSISTVYSNVCIFCDKTSKYLKGSRTREKLIQCIDLRVDDTLQYVAQSQVILRRSEEEKKLDERILATTSRDIVAAEAHYYKPCYIRYTQHKQATEKRASYDHEYKEEDMYTIAETSAYIRLFEYIRLEIIGCPSVVQMTDLTSKLVSFMNELGISNIKANTKKHIRRKIETEFASSLSFISTR